MFTFTLKEPNKKMSLRIEISGREKVEDIKRIVNECWREDDFVLRNGCSILRDEETISDVILNDDVVFILKYKV